MMGLWDWYSLIAMATSLGVVTHFGKISDAVAQMLPSNTTRGQFNFWAVMMALMMGVVWPATWYVVYDNNRPSM